MNKEYTFETDTHPLTGVDLDEPLIVTLPIEIVQCYDCRGKGTTYLGWASCDQPAFTEEDMYEEGPEFMEDYMHGAYDKTCPECGGSGKVDEIAWERATDPLAKAYRDYLDDEAAYQRECDAERRYGC